MTSVLHELLVHKTWATLRVIELCRTLGQQQLDTTIPGTYGTIRATLAHLVNADHSYHRRMTGLELGPPLDQQAHDQQSNADRDACERVDVEDAAIDRVRTGVRVVQHDEHAETAQPGGIRLASVSRLPRAAFSGPTRPGAMYGMRSAASASK